MGKNPEQEIQKKLVELELSIKEEEAKNLPATSNSTKSTRLTTTSTQSKADAEFSMEMSQLGGIALVALGLYFIFAHVQLTTAAGLFSSGPLIGAVILPLLVGIGMLFYNYKSRVAQIVTAAGAVGILVALLTSLRMFFAPLSLIDFVLMAVPLCAGGALLAKAHVKKLGIKESEKTS